MPRSSRPPANPESVGLHTLGKSEALKLRASGEAEQIRATGAARADAYRAGVESLGPDGYVTLQLMQIVGERNVRVVPDVAVSGAGSALGLGEGLLGVLLRDRVVPPAAPAPPRG